MVKSFFVIVLNLISNLTFASIQEVRENKQQWLNDLQARDSYKKSHAAMELANLLRFESIPEAEEPLIQALKEGDDACRYLSTNIARRMLSCDEQEAVIFGERDSSLIYFYQIFLNNFFLMC